MNALNFFQGIHGRFFNTPSCSHSVKLWNIFKEIKALLSSFPPSDLLLIFHVRKKTPEGLLTIGLYFLFIFRIFDHKQKSMKFIHTNWLKNFTVENPWHVKRFLSFLPFSIKFKEENLFNNFLKYNDPKGLVYYDENKLHKIST